jgi:hypothetical protein
MARMITRIGDHLQHGIGLLCSYRMARMPINDFYEKCSPVLPSTSPRDNFNIT